MQNQFADKCKDLRRGEKNTQYVYTSQKKAKKFIEPSFIGQR